MSHQPFETWILDHETLPPADRRALQEHLDTCGQCRKMNSRWQAVELELRARRMAAPAPGFTLRWQASLAARQAREQRKQAWRTFGVLLGSALLVLMVIGIYTIATTSPTDWLVATVGAFNNTRALINMIISALMGWLNITPLAVNIVLWIYLTVAFCLIALAWVFILWRTNSVGVLNK